jgi:hypothetical protein
MADLENLDHGLEDEDKTDEGGENIFGELGKVFYQAGTLKKYHFLKLILKTLLSTGILTVLGQS